MMMTIPEGSLSECDSESLLADFFLGFSVFFFFSVVPLFRVQCSLLRQNPNLWVNIPTRELTFNPSENVLT
jgi:hypothetical protein